MKNRLNILIILVFIFSSCSDFSGNEDAVEASLKPGPVTRTTTPSTPTRTYYDLTGVAYGNNTFVAVGQSGTVRISSDNGATWDNNSTSGTTKWLAEIAYGNSTFVAVGQSGTHLYSSDDGATWSVGTWTPTVDITGVAFGNNTFLGVSSTYLTKSTDNGANWDLECSGLRIYDIAFGGNSKFVGSGGSGAIGITDNGSSCGLGDSDTTTHYLYGTTSGNNKFLSVGSSGKLILFDNNGSNVSNLTSPVTKTLYSAAYGNNIFVAVGSKTVVVTNNVGGSATETENTYSFNDVTFGNGIFVAVGNDEIIYTSSDGDAWTKVYP